MPMRFPCFHRDAGRVLDAYAPGRKIEVDMKIHSDMLRNYFFWYTD